MFLVRKVSGCRIKGFRHDGQNHTRRQSLLPRSEQALAPHSETAITPSSVAIDLKGGVPTRICPQLPSSGFRRDGPQSLPHRAEQSLPHQSGLTRAGKSISSEERGMAVSSIRGGEKMERAIRLGARTTTPRSRQTIAPQSRLTPLGTARN